MTAGRTGRGRAESHAATAERYLAACTKPIFPANEMPIGFHVRSDAVALAQLHATLALFYQRQGGST